MLTALLLALGLFAVGMLAIPARIFIGDPYTWREEAINLVLFHRLEIPPGIAAGHGVHNQYFTQNPVNGKYYSKYGLMNGLLNLAPIYAEYKLTSALPPWDSANRRLYIGIFYAALGAVFAAALFLLCGHYGVPPAAGVLYTLAVVFCTYAGYYLRATNSEAYQLVFFTLFFERVAAFRAGEFRDYRKLHAAWFWLLCLVHVKISHLAVAGLFGALVFAYVWRGGLRGRALARLAAWRLGLPLYVILVTVGWVNWVKFGSPFASGYTMWGYDEYVHNIPPWTMVWNVFFTQQWGVPIHFPLLLLAPFGAREFYRRFSFDGALASAIFVFLFVAIASMPVWKGEWAYGPRYFLFVLPALALPALLCFARFLNGEERRKPAVSGLLAGTAVVLAVSAFFQFQVARLDPFFCYWARPNIAAYHDDELTEYWNKTNFAWIAAYAWNHRENAEEVWWLQRLKARVPDSTYASEVKRFKTWIARTNFYWWSPRD